jgi:hypothetical protein
MILLIKTIQIETMRDIMERLRHERMKAKAVNKDMAAGLGLAYTIISAMVQEKSKEEDMII